MGLYSELINKAIVALKVRTAGGASRQAITAWIVANKETGIQQSALRGAFTKAVADGILDQTGQRFKLTDKGKVSLRAEQSREQRAEQRVQKPSLSLIFFRDFE
jgi:DNA-binding transcriptional regulator PaaX